ncbi:MAG TPA: M20/M25/M40 family metallo-hydrolase [Thermoleophilaceae bacterium]|nr:M20/M25/M40 family metallo-hydrolase [Thermoleophilaceae bacterium]
MAAPELLLRLLTAPGPPGHEREPARVWREAAEAFAEEVTTDALGTTVARVAGRGEHPLMAVVGHIDEIALLVSHIGEKGFLHVVNSGGWDPQVLVGQRVEVLTRDGTLPGVVGRKPIHILDAEERKKAMRLKDLHVDIGAKDGDEARSLASPGDQVVIAAEPLELPNGRLAARSHDNRLGSYVALEVARRVHEAGGGAGPVAGVAAVQEEVGAHGARVMAYGLEPDLAVVVDVAHATDAPGVEPGELGEHGLGSGPVITRGAVVSRPLNDLLDEVAAAEGIECSTEAAGGSTYTDADVVHMSRTGVPTAVVSIPLRYMHSPVELVELADVEATIRLITALALRLEADTSLARW